MRKRNYSLVCRCTPEKGLVLIRARVLVEMVNREIPRIKCMENLRRKAHRAMNLGSVCANTGHPWWAIKIFDWAQWLVQCRDWDEWRYADWNDRWYQLEAMWSEAEARELGKKADDVWKSLGHPEMALYEHTAKRYYQDLWIEKFCCDDDIFDEDADEPDIYEQ